MLFLYKFLEVKLNGKGSVRIEKRLMTTIPISYLLFKI